MDDWVQEHMYKGYHIDVIYDLMSKFKSSILVFFFGDLDSKVKVVNDTKVI